MSANFKTCMFGGFNREDVVAFIEKTAQEHEERLSALENENAELRRGNAEKERELVSLRRQVTEKQEEAAANSELTAQVEALRELTAQLEQELEQLRGQAQEYQSLRDHIAEIEISAHRRTEEFRAEAIRKLRGMISKQQDWCEKTKDQYLEMSGQFAEKLRRAQQTLSDPDMSGFDEMEQGLQDLSDSFDA